MADLPTKAQIASVTSTDGSTQLYPQTVKAAILDWEESTFGRCTYRLVIGTSTAGWTASDCDYLCDGVDDNIEIQAAIDALPESGGSIVFLDGVYQLGEYDRENLDWLRVNLKSVAFIGNLNVTIFSPFPGRQLLEVYGLPKGETIVLAYFYGITFKNVNIACLNVSIKCYSCTFYNLGIRYSFNAGQSYSGQCICDIAKNQFFMSENFGSDEVVCPIYVNYIDGSNLFVTVEHNHIYVGPNVFCLGAMNITGPSAIVLNNSIETHCTTRDHNAALIYAGSFIGNIIIGGGSHINGYGQNPITVSGNTFIDGSLYVSNGSASGNVILRARIWAEGDAVVSGNHITAAERDNDVCIVTMRGGNTETMSTSPLIYGNRCIGGEYGILLKNSDVFHDSKSNAMIVGNYIRNSKTAGIRVESKWSKCLIANNMCVGCTNQIDGSDHTLNNNITD